MLVADGQHLLLGRLPGGLARELREPRQDSRDRADRGAGLGLGDADAAVGDGDLGDLRDRVADAQRELDAERASRADLGSAVAAALGSSLA